MLRTLDLIPITMRVLSRSVLQRDHTGCCRQRMAGAGPGDPRDTAAAGQMREGVAQGSSGHAFQQTLQGQVTGWLVMKVRVEREGRPAGF